MRYDLRLRIRRVAEKRYIYNKVKRNKSLWYLLKTILTWYRLDNRSYHYSLTINRHNANGKDNQ